MPSSLLAVSPLRSACTFACRVRAFCTAPDPGVFRGVAPRVSAATRVSGRGCYLYIELGIKRLSGGLSGACVRAGVSVPGRGGAAAPTNLPGVTLCGQSSAGLPECFFLSSSSRLLQKESR